MKVQWLRLPPDAAPLYGRTRDALDRLVGWERRQDARINALPECWERTRLQQELCRNAQAGLSLSARVNATVEAHKRHAKWATVDRMRADVEQLEAFVSRLDAGGGEG